MERRELMAHRNCSSLRCAQLSTCMSTTANTHFTFRDSLTSLHSGFATVMSIELLLGTADFMMWQAKKLRVLDAHRH